MWQPWGKSTVRIHRSKPSPFSCSSFKDVQTLLIDEPPPSSPYTKPKPSVFHRVRLANSLLRTWSTHLHQSHKLSRSLAQPVPDAAAPDPPQPAPPAITLTGSENRIVVYFTSLRVVRATFEDCKSVRSILRGFRVVMEERDVSMDSRFLGELQRIMGQTKLALPRVFIGGRYVGGAEEVRALHESGELKKLLEGLPAADSRECHVCGDHRFVLCEECCGGRKVYTEKGGFKACTECNESGLIRCPSCSCAPFSLSSRSSSGSLSHH